MRPLLYLGTAGPTLGPAGDSKPGSALAGGLDRGNDAGAKRLGGALAAGSRNPRLDLFVELTLRLAGRALLEVAADLLELRRRQLTVDVFKEAIESLFTLMR